ncbi:MAG: FAD binding domain-containing protein [Candidatus Hodarchaeota archaeon]
MLTNLKNHFYPKSIDETLSFLKKPNSRLLAGGTALSLISSPSTENLIDLQNVGLSYIKEDAEYFKIGAMTSVYNIYKNETLTSSLRTAADKIGDVPLSHAVTIGGNLAILYPWVDLPPMLWALDASFILYDPEKRIMSSDEFVKYSREKDLCSRGALITEIQVKKPPKNSFSEFQSLTLIENEKSQLNLASYFEWEDNGVISNARLVVSATTKFLTRLAAEKLLIGKKITDELITECIKSTKDVEMVPKYKSSKEYRQHILGVYLKRTLENCKAQIGE